MIDIKMIAVDLDSTLLRGDKTVSEFTYATLSECRRRGLRVVFATARNEDSCVRFTEKIKPDAIASNGGALVRVEGKVIYRAAMNVNIVNSLRRRLIATSSVNCITLYSDNGYYVNIPVDDTLTQWLEYRPIYNIDFTKAFTFDAYKIIAEISEKAEAYAVVADFRELGVTPFSGEIWYRYAMKNADKFSAVKETAAYFNINIKNVAAFGDDYGDIGMLTNCGVGIAVDNAAPEVKKAAAFICGSNDDDGVAKWINENLLQSI